MDKEKELWGKKFHIVEHGLDEAEVYSFVESLTNQYGTFAKKLEDLDALLRGLADRYNALAQRVDNGNVRERPNHNAGEGDPNEIPSEEYSLSDGDSELHFETNGNKMAQVESLKMFAESTVVEAARQAIRTKHEAENKAKMKAAELINRAKLEAQKETDRLVQEAQKTAREQAQQIVWDAEAKAAEILKSAEQDLGSARSLAIDQDDGTRLDSQAKESLDQIKEAVRECFDLIQTQEENLTSSGKKVDEADVREALNTILEQVRSISGLCGEEISMPENDEQPVQTKETPSKRKKSSEDALFEGTVELALPPPVGLDRMLQLHKHLKQTPNVDVLNLGGSVDKGITIRVLIESPTPLLKVIKELPEVSQVSEELPDGEKVVPSREGEAQPIRRVIVNTNE